MVTGIDQGLAQLSLVAFTTLMPSGALAFVAIAALLLSRRLAPAEAARLARFLIIPLAARRCPTRCSRPGSSSRSRGRRGC